MAAGKSEIQTDQVATNNALPITRQAAVSNLDTILSALDSNAASPLRLFASNPSSSILNIAAQEIQKADGSGLSAPPLSSTVPTYVATTIDFQALSTTGGTVTITWPTVVSGHFYRVGFTLIAGNVVQAIFSAGATSLGAVANPGTLFISGGVSLGWVDLVATSTTQFKTAGSATSIIENSVSGTSTIHTFGSGTGGGSGTGSGIGDDLTAMAFRASFNDNFTEGTTSSACGVNGSAGFTNAAYSPANLLWAMLYDGSKTVASGTSTTQVNLNSAISGYTPAVGDLVVIGGVAKKITSIVLAGQQFGTETWSSIPTTGAQVTVSQAVHTVDVYNYTGTGVALAAAFSAISPNTFSEIMVDYKDNATPGSALWTPDTSPFAAFVASVDNTNWTTQQVRATNETDLAGSTICPTAGTSLYIRFYAAATSGSGTVNVLNYRAMMQKITSASSGFVVNQAYGLTNVSGAQSNLTMSVVGGKSVATLTFSYPLGVNSGFAYGALDVTVNGQRFPRSGTTGATTADGSYSEYAANAIQLDRDYSSQALNLQIVQHVVIVDSNTQNTTGIAGLQGELTDGMQGYVSPTANVIVATTGTTSPAAPGTFYSSINGRATIPDLTQDLKPRLSIERIPTQAAFVIPGEFGPNGEQIFGLPNDVTGQVRFGGQWTLAQGVAGNMIFSSTVGDFVEITFYGSGLNLLYRCPTATMPGVTYSVDGGSTTALTFSSTHSTIISNLNTAPSMVFSVINNLTPGVHTVRLAVTSVSSNFLEIDGFEIINQVSAGSNLVTVNPGVGYIGGKKLISASQASFAYNAPASGSNGGRVLIYQKADGTIGESFTAVGSPAFLTSASHANEEIARVFYPREFGAGNTGDFSRFLSGSNQASFTLDDGTTTLVANGGVFLVSNGIEGLGMAATSTPTTFSFVGTGLDIQICAAALTGTTVTYAVDGGSATSIGTVNGTYLQNFKIASGLPYGTHTVRLTITATTGGTFIIGKFVTYQPKTPTLPSGAVQVGSYNVMANFASLNSTGLVAASTGVLMKTPTREFIYSGTWSAGITWNTAFPGAYAGSTTTGDSVSYTFFGTGFELYVADAATTISTTLNIDGSLYTGSATATGTSSTWTAGTGTWVTSTSSVLTVTGLTLGLHTIKLTAGTISSNTLGFYGIGIIVPIHSFKSNLYADLQNTLMVGSNAISDDRFLTPIKNPVPATKAWAQAYGVSSSPTTTSTAAIPCPDMSCTVKTSGGALALSVSASFIQSAAGNWVGLIFVVDGVGVGELIYSTGFNSGQVFTVSNALTVPVAPGVHKVDAYWQVSAGTGTATGTQRVLTVRET